MQKYELQIKVNAKKSGKPDFFSYLCIFSSNLFLLPAPEMSTG